MSGLRAAALAAAMLGPGASVDAWAEALRVYAAASLTDAFAEVATTFEKAHHGEAVALSFAGSQVLRTQIEQGAAADVFASADLSHTEALQQQGLLQPSEPFAHNRVVVVLPADGSRVGDLRDLTRPGIKIVVAGSSVPIGRYTTEVLVRLSSGVYGEGFGAGVRANVVSEETNVRAVLAKVGLGEADAGFVYTSDAASASGRVRTLEIPERFNVVAEYRIAVLTKSAAVAMARTFVSFVRGSQGQAILAKHGFLR
jgi:molybdate transport system substrate-binding protein